jgi:hypothetical protein
MGWSKVDTDTEYAPANRNNQRLAYDIKRDRVVLFGGQGGTPATMYTIFGDTWNYDFTNYKLIGGGRHLAIKCSRLTSAAVDVAAHGQPEPEAE